ncbi:GNAT family N-acetyltransferase [Gottfriedia sp. NPDC057991]|uniref:GNAT family N-acetyltransferase n=1 Tax=Gottfriedia sp. NPDC057991 TaxID=3346298 RepID=UPI0036DD828B
MLNIRNVRLEDLTELVEIEHLCFSKEEAATKQAFEKRIKLIPDSFFVAEENGKLVGLVNGPIINETFITDDLFSEIKKNPSTGGHQSILGIAVAPQNQNKGIASKLLSHIENVSKENKRDSITLTCKENLIHFYENHGFINNGISSSTHGGVKWYNMSKKL